MSSELELKKEETSEESGFDVQGVLVELKDVQTKVEELNKVNARLEGELKEIKDLIRDLGRFTGLKEKREKDEVECQRNDFMSLPSFVFRRRYNDERWKKLYGEES